MSAIFGLNTPYETSLNQAIRCSGIGLHTGAEVSMRLRPAPIGTGVLFVRTDVDDRDPKIAARFDTVGETQLGTVIGNEAGVTVSTIEHLMAALTGCGVDNVLIEIDGPEVPIMDGSAAPFVFLIECAGISVSDSPRRIIRILKPVSVEDDGKFAGFTPGEGFTTEFEIDFETPVIGTQRFEFELTSAGFKTELCRARTFGFLKDVDYLKSIGLARGGSLENAVVIDGDRIVNEEPLRYKDEFVRHKTLDAIGDLALAGAQIRGHFTARRSGHGLNNKLLHQLFAMSDAWEWVSSETGEGDVEPAPTKSSEPVRAAGR